MTGVEVETITPRDDIFVEEIPDYGDLMTLEDFQDGAECGALTDDDGGGEWSNGTKMTVGCDVFSEPPEGATHVVWFNK